MLVFKLVEIKIIDGVISEEKTLQHFTQEKGLILQNEKHQIKKFLEQLTELDIESETDDIPLISSLSKEKAVVSQDIYYETNNDGEDVTVQIQLTIKKVNLKKELRNWIKVNMFDYSLNHLEKWNEKYSNYTISELKHELEFNYDFSTEFKLIVSKLNLPESFELSDELKDYFSKQFIKSTTDIFISDKSFLMDIMSDSI